MRVNQRQIVTGLLCSIAVLGASCGGGNSAPPPVQPGQSSTGSVPRANVSLDKNAYPVFPNPDTGADPSVPAEQGGRGFTGEGWETNINYELVGDPHAIKGGVLRQELLDFPSTLRMSGPEANTVFNDLVVKRLVYEPLLWLHRSTLEFVPALATHWQISPDKLTYRFRINPNARWSDGQPVVADDVVASWDLIMDKGFHAPMDQLTYGKFERPVAESKYIVRVKSKQKTWKNFLYFATQEGSMVIFPAHALKNVTGAIYEKDYNFKVLPGTGPYAIAEADIQKGRGISLRRRHDYWAANQRRNVGLDNFDELQYIVVRDENLLFEMFKKGDLDFHYENVSRRWVQEMSFDKVQRGLVQKTKVYNDYPSGIQGLAVNTRKPPFDDVRVREALAYLLDRNRLIETLFFGEYPPLNSYFAGGVYENPDNPKMPYDPQLALKLLNDAGWTRDAQGRLAKNGQPLTIELLNGDKGSERWLTVYQDDLRKVGITLNLRLVTPETQFTMVMDRKFDVSLMAWGAETFPNPEDEYSSKMADTLKSNNITGVKDKRIDELLDAYDVEFDQHRREAMIREIDGILANLHHYVLGWDAPFQRIAYWNKFGHPAGYLGRVDDYNSAAWLWWVDPDKERQLNAASTDPSIKMPIAPLEDRYWKEYARRAPQNSGQTTGSVTK
jgi:microcin C transport system substrate-binding protein